MEKILAVVPSYHAVEPAPFMHFLVLSLECGRDEAKGLYSLRWTVPGPKAKTIPARNTVTEIAVEAGADRLLLIDDDMLCPQDMVRKLILHDVPIVSPLFFKTRPIEPLCFEFDELGNTVPMYQYPRNTLFECPAGTGTGVMLVKTEVFKALGRPYWTATSTDGTGEDVNLCQRAAKLGFKTYCDSSVKVRQMDINDPVGEENYLRLSY